MGIKQTADLAESWIEQEREQKLTLEDRTVRPKRPPAAAEPAEAPAEIAIPASAWD